MDFLEQAWWEWHMFQHHIQTYKILGLLPANPTRIDFWKSTYIKEHVVLISPIPTAIH